MFSAFLKSTTGLGQVQLKLNDLKSAMSNFEKVLETQPDSCDCLKVSFAILVFV